MGRLVEPTEEELEIVRNNPVITSAGLVGRSRETIRRWRRDHLAKPSANRGRPRRKLPEALVSQLGTVSDSELARLFDIPKNSIRNYRLEHGIPALGSDLFNSGSTHLAVTSLLFVDDIGHFELEFPLSELDLQSERPRPSIKDDEAFAHEGPSVFLWGHMAEPFLPRDMAGRSVVEHLQRHLAAGTAVVLASVAPERSLDDAHALLIGFDGNIRVGSYGNLIDAPGDYIVQRTPTKQLLKIPLD